MSRIICFLSYFLQIRFKVHIIFSGFYTGRCFKLKMYQIRHVRFDGSSMTDVPFGELTASLSRAQSTIEEFNELQKKTILQSASCQHCGFKSIFVGTVESLSEVKKQCMCSRYNPNISEFDKKNIESELMYQVDCANYVKVEDASEKMYINVIEV